MHELGITQEVVDVVQRRAGGARVARIVLEIGRLSCVFPDAVRFAFEVLREGTSLEAAELEIVERPGRARCRACGTERDCDDPIAPECACGGHAYDWLSGTEILVREMEVL